MPERTAPLYELIRSSDELVGRIFYWLYGLTEEEIRVVEAGTTVNDRRS